MNEAFSRSALLWGEEGNERLRAAHVAVFGVGGVGGYAVEALARAGVGALTLVDSDVIAQSNLNRQLIATVDTIGMSKVQAAKQRVLSIHPECRVTALPMFYLPENADEIPLAHFTYIIDAIDTMSAKIELITRAAAAGVPIVCAMGCGNKLDPTRFCVTDLYKTSTDPVARVLRRELRRRGIEKLEVVYSTEPARQPLAPPDHAGEDEKALPRQEGKDASASPRARQTPGSVSFVPGAAGLILAGVVIRAIAGV
ncbi:MAG: tRNA threonylcarbamoyladenosine dehydratase [Ruthenibacterium sp.]